MRGIHQSPVNSPHKGQWRGALMFSLICARINGWVNNREAGDLPSRSLWRHCSVFVGLVVLFDFFCRVGPIINTSKSSDRKWRRIFDHRDWVQKLSRTKKNDKNRPIAYRKHTEKVQRHRWQLIMADLMVRQCWKQYACCFFLYSRQLLFPALVVSHIRQSICI